LQGKFANTLNGSAQSVAGLQGTNTTWRAGENHITGMQFK